MTDSKSMPDVDMPAVEMTDDSRPQGGDYPFTRDLNPDFMAGENYGEQGPHPEKTTARTAFDVKGAHYHLRDIEDGDLKQIPIMPPGSRLEQGATYVDLFESPPREFKATGNMVAGSNNWYAPKSEVPYPIWNRLIGVQNPERLDQADES